MNDKDNGVKIQEPQSPEQEPLNLLADGLETYLRSLFASERQILLDQIKELLQQGKLTRETNISNDNELENLKQEYQNNMEAANQEINNLNQKLAAKEQALAELQKENNEKIKQLNSIIASKNNELELQKRGYASLQLTATQEKDNLKQNLADQEKKLTELQNHNRELQKECTNLYNKYGRFEEAQAAFASLSPRTREQIKNIFPGASLYSLLASGLVEDSCINSLWDSIQYLLRENMTEDVEKLKKIYDLFFDIYNERNPGRPIYTRIKQPIGQIYDRNTQRILNPSKTDGVVCAVLLDGYKDTLGKVIKHSLVIVKE